MTRPGRGQAGFTLLEVLIALLIAALMLAAVFRLVVSQDNSRAHYQLEGRMLLLARQLINRAVLNPDLAPGLEEGRSGALSWQLEVLPSATFGAGSGQPGPGELRCYAIIAGVRHESGKSLELHAGAWRNPR